MVSLSVTAFHRRASLSTGRKLTTLSRLCFCADFLCYLQYGCDCSNCEDPNIYPKARFVSEFGIQSYPTWETLSQALAAGDLYVDSGQMYWRQRKFSDAPSSVFNFASLRFRFPADCKYYSQYGTVGKKPTLTEWVRPTHQHTCRVAAGSNKFCVELTVKSLFEVDQAHHLLLSPC